MNLPPNSTDESGSAPPPTPSEGPEPCSARPSDWAELPRFNPARMDEVAEQAGSYAIVHELVGLFLKDVDERLRDLECAVLHADPRFRERVGHSIKGGSANLGAERLAAMAKSIEHCAEETASDTLASMLQEFTALKLDLGQRYR